MTCGIYKIENVINGMVYIGRSYNIERRITEHKRLYKLNEANKYLYKEMNKYGINNFVFCILEECDKEIICEKEVYYINKYNSYKKGYNKTRGGKDGMPSSLENNIEEIVYLLKNTKINFIEIANKFNVSKSMISMINNGKRCYFENETYPLRKTKFCKNKKCIVCGEKITQKAKMCKKCYFNYRRNKIAKKDELIDRVLNNNFEKTGIFYGVSGNTIKKWLKYYGEPTKRKDLFNKYKIENKKYKKINKNTNKIEMYNDNNKIIFDNIDCCTKYMLDLFELDKDRCKEGISRVLNKKRKTYHGYIFKYIE